MLQLSLCRVQLSTLRHHHQVFWADADSWCRGTITPETSFKDEDVLLLAVI